MSKKVPKGGIKKGSAEKVMKSVLADFRLSHNAVELAISHTEHCLQEIGRMCKASLLLADRKTLSLKYLTLTLENSCKFEDLRDIAATGSDQKKGKGNRNAIATASVERVIKAVLGGENRISSNAKDAFSRIAQAVLVRVAIGARGFAANAKRSTVQEKDVASALALFKQGYELTSLHKAPVHKKKKEEEKKKVQPKKKSTKSSK